MRLTVIICFSMLLAACIGKEQEAEQGWGRPLQATVISPEKRMVSEWDEYTGRFRAAQRVEIRARVSGYVDVVKFNDGQIVEEGDVLFVIDQQPFQILVDRATAVYEQTKREFERAEGLRKTRAISEDDYGQRLQDKQVAKAGYEEALLNLEWTEVKAPFTGRASRNYVDVGNLVSGGNASATLLTTIVSMAPVEFYFQGSESDVLKYIRLTASQQRPGERDQPWPVYVKLKDEDTFKHEGTVNFVDNEIDLNTGTKDVRATFANTDGLLEPGLFGRLRINATAPFEAMIIPEHIISTEQTRKYVYTLTPENTAQRSYITLGKLTGDGMRIVKSGLDPQDKVITGNLQMIQPGAQIEPVAETTSKL